MRGGSYCTLELFNAQRMATPESQDDGKRPRPEDEEQRRQSKESEAKHLGSGSPSPSLISASQGDTSPGSNGSGAVGAGRSGGGNGYDTAARSVVRHSVITTTASTSRACHSLGGPYSAPSVEGDAAFNEQLHDHAVECYTKRSN